MKISVILLTANPTEKQYAWKESFQSYLDFADEVIVINGGEEDLQFTDNKKLIIINKPDPPVWTWAEHAKNLNLALEKATGDWIIKVDIDWIFHQKTMAELRQKLSTYQAHVVTMQKMTFYPKMRYVQKGEIPNIINAKYKKTIKFGRDKQQYSDLTYPIATTGALDKDGVALGNLVGQKYWAKSGVEFWNFDYTFATIELMRKKWLRMSASHKEYFGETTWGETEEKAEELFLRNMRGKFRRGLDIVDITMLPKYIHERIQNLQPEQFGHSGWDLL